MKTVKIIALYHNTSLLSLGALIVVLLPYASAVNPIVTARYSADPAAHIWAEDKETLYMYTSVDLDNSTSMDTMRSYAVYSTKDMVHWHDHGIVLDLDNVSWAQSHMWAPDAAYRDGTYYLVFCALENGTGIFRTGLAISDKPFGPFKDIGYISGVDWGQDPALFVDDDGSAYLYWGLAGFPWVARLTPDFLAILPETKRKMRQEMPNFYEGPWVFKRSGLYYMMYAAKDRNDEKWGEWLEYSTALSPMGPFSYGGVILDTLDNYEEVGKSWTSHGSIIQFKGQWYLFYHTTHLSGGNDKRRSAAVEYLHFNEDGSIKPVTPTLTGVNNAATSSHGAQDGHHSAHGLQSHGHGDQSSVLQPVGEVTASGVGRHANPQALHEQQEHVGGDQFSSQQQHGGSSEESVSALKWREHHRHHL